MFVSTLNEWMNERIQLRTCLMPLIYKFVCTRLAHKYCQMSQVYYYYIILVPNNEHDIRPWTMTTVHYDDSITAAQLCSSGMNGLSSRGKHPKLDSLANKNYWNYQNQNWHNWLRRQVLQVCQIGWRLPFPSSPHVGVKYKHFFCMYVCMYHFL